MCFDQLSQLTLTIALKKVTLKVIIAPHTDCECTMENLHTVDIIHILHPENKVTSSHKNETNLKARTSKTISYYICFRRNASFDNSHQKL